MFKAPNDGSVVKFDDKVDDKIDESIKAKLDDYDRKMLSYLGRLYYSMNSEKLDLDTIQSSVEALQRFNSKSEFNYLNNLLYPEKCKGCKIPSPIPVPSNVFQLHNTVTLNTNSSGNLVMMFNPFFLYDRDSLHDIIIKSNEGDTTRVHPEFASSLVVNNSNELDGHTVGVGGWYPVNIGQGIPSVYDQYRLVSSSIVVRYIGRLDYVQGVIGGAIIYDKKITGAGRVTYSGSKTGYGDFLLTDDNVSFPHPVGLVNQTYSKYTNFDTAIDSFYHQENVMLEGIRELYFPIDNTFEEYQKVGSYKIMQDETQGDALLEFSMDGPFIGCKSGFSQMVYILGGVPNSASYKVDIYCNFECLPNPDFLNYMPLSITPTHIDSYEKQQAIAYVQNKPIMNTKETQMVVYKPSIFEKMKQKFGNSLPGIMKLAANGLIGLIPGLKPGLSLAGSLIGMELDK